jgi:hypothetical protein
LNDAALYLLGRIHSTHLLLQLPPLRSTHVSQTDPVLCWYCELPALQYRHHVAAPSTIGIVAACVYVSLEQPLYIGLLNRCYYAIKIEKNVCTYTYEYIQ